MYDHTANFVNVSSNPVCFVYYHKLENNSVNILCTSNCFPKIVCTSNSFQKIVCTCNSFPFSNSFQFLGISLLSYIVLSNHTYCFVFVSEQIIEIGKLSMFRKLGSGHFNSFPTILESFLGEKSCSEVST